MPTAAPTHDTALIDASAAGTRTAVNCANTPPPVRYLLPASGVSGSARGGYFPEIAAAPV